MNLGVAMESSEVFFGFSSVFCSLFKCCIVRESGMSLVQYCVVYWNVE